MPSIDLLVETPIKRSVRVQQLEATFDVPRVDNAKVGWKANLPLEEREWGVGLIVGPSGCGKTTIARHLFGDAVDRPLKWTKSAAVIDDFAKSLSMQAITDACMAVGFNTIPAWMRPFEVLSNGEKFRVELARRLVESDGLTAIDEFTSVVDRQVAQIGSHAVQKYARKVGRQFVAVTCHYDVLEWLQPDWVFDPSTGEFEWRSLRRRPEIEVVVSPIAYAAWRVFAPFHYLTAELHRSARCFALFVADRLAAFAGMLFRPTRGAARQIIGCSRLVTLPDFQGLGLAFALIDSVASCYRAVGKDVHTYPAHPALIRGFDRSPKWQLRKKPGNWSSKRGPTSSVPVGGGRPCAVFRYVGESADGAVAHKMLGVKVGGKKA